MDRSGAPEQRAKALEAGFDLHLVRPVEPERLEVLLNEYTPRDSARVVHPRHASSTISG